MWSFLKTAFFFTLVFYGAYLVGTYGFCQIVGTLKYHKTFSFGRILFILIFWLSILSFVAYAVIHWLPRYAIALYIAYGITFILSFSTKPDDEV